MAGGHAITFNPADIVQSGLWEKRTHLNQRLHLCSDSWSTCSTQVVLYQYIFKCQWLRVFSHSCLSKRPLQNFIFTWRNVAITLLLCPVFCGTHQVCYCVVGGKTALFFGRKIRSHFKISWALPKPRRDCGPLNIDPYMLDTICLEPTKWKYK